MSLASLVVFLAVALVAAASFFGFAWLARTDRKRASLVLLLLDVGWLGYLTVRILAETYDITRAVLSLITFWQVIYTIAGVLGWFFGRSRRPS